MVVEEKEAGQDAVVREPGKDDKRNKTDHPTETHQP